MLRLISHNRSNENNSGILCYLFQHHAQIFSDCQLCRVGKKNIHFFKILLNFILEIMGTCYHFNFIRYTCAHILGTTFV